MPRQRNAAPAKKAGPIKLTTPPFTGSYVHIAEAYSNSDDIDPCFSILIVLDPNDKAHAAFIEEMEDAVDRCIEEKWGETPRKFSSPIRNGEDIGDSEELEGMICVNARSDRRPGVVDSHLQKILNVEEECYSGATYRATIVAYAWTHKVGGNGVSFGLNNVMKMGDGEPLGGGRASPEEDFKDYAERRPRGRDRGEKDDDRGVQRSRTRGRVVDNADEEDDERSSSRRRRR